MTKYEAIPYKSIVSVFHEPDIKAQLSSQVRYNRYRLSENPEKFSLILGPDVRFVSHPGVTYNIARKFIIAQNNSHTADNIFLDEADMLLTAALCHDWGELKFDNFGYGDVTFEERGELHEKQESKIFESVLGKIGSTSDRFLTREVYRDVVQDRESRLGRMFNAIERIGYLQTGLRAYRGYEGERIENWAGLTGNVLSNQIVTLVKYSREFPYVKQVLEENTDLITHAFEEISQMEIPFDNRSIPSYDFEKFQKNLAAWRTFLSSP